MAPRNRRFSLSHVRQTRYEAVETGYDPGQLAFLAEPSNPQSPPPIKAKARVRHAARDYKPTALRWWFHGILIVCLATCIGLTEYTIHTLRVYNGGDVVSLLWSRGDREGYQVVKEKATSTTTYFQKIPRNDNNTITSPVSQVGPTSTTSTLSTRSSSFVVVDSPTSTTATTTSVNSGYPDDGKATTASTTSPAEFLQSQQSYDGEDVGTGAPPASPATAAASTEKPKTNLLHHTSKQVPMQLGKVTSTSTGKDYTPTSDATPTTEPSTTSTSDTRAYHHVGSTVSMKKETKSTFAHAGVAGMAYVEVASNGGGLRFGSSTAIRKGTASATTTLTEAFSSGGGLQFGKTTHYEAGNTLSADTETPSVMIITPVPQTPSTTGEATDATPSVDIGQQMETGSPSETGIEQGTIDSEGRTTVQAWTTTLPGDESDLQPTMATQSEGNQGYVSVIRQTATYAPRETTIEQTTTDSEGRTTVQAWMTTLPASTSVFQSTVTTQSEGHQGHMAVVQQTETWAPRETTIERTTTDSEGREIVQAWKTTLPGSTSVLPSTTTAPLEDQQEGYVTVIQQTKTWDSSETTIERTTTNADGQVIVQAVKTTLPAGTSVVQSSLSILPGETLVTVPTAMPTTIGGSTKVIQMTMFDSEGHSTISSYTTVIGGTPTVTTRSDYVATSLPSEDAVITISTIVPTTIGGTTELEESTFTNAQGILTTSPCTTVLGGTPTFTTVPLVVATPVPSGDVLVSKLTVVPTTIGGTTEVLPTTFTNAQGQLTTSFYATVLHGTPTSTTEWTIVPTPTSTNLAGGPSNGNGNVEAIVYEIDLEEYILGTFLPTILAVMVGFLVKLISINARLMQPFHVLATADEFRGATAESSIFLRFDRWSGAFSLSRAIRWRQPVIGITDFLVLCAGLLAPVAAGAVSVHVPSDCARACIGTLEVSIVLSRVLEGLMATMMVLLIALVFLVSVLRWRTGVSQNPWSMAGMASLCLEPEIRNKIRSIPRGLNVRVEDSAILKTLEGSRYRLGDFWTAPNPETTSSKGYGVVVTGNDGMAKQLLEREESGEEDAEKLAAGHKRAQPFVLLTWWGRCILILIFSCTLILLTYYENSSVDSGFERFMDSQGFGVSFFFTALGVVLGGCMETVFRSVATISPYLQMTNDVLPAERSILLSPPTNAFYGLYSAARQRNLFFGVLSFTTLLGELFLPVTLSHVPFSLLQTTSTQVACAWLSIAILALMILVLASSFSIAWPHMPIDPRTVAGGMFYVCDSWMLETFHGMSTEDKKERDLDIKYLRLKYGYGYIEGAVSGKQRMGVDVCGDTGEAAIIMRRDKMQYG